MTAIARLSRRPLLDSDIVILARTTDYGAAKFLRVVAVDCAHLAPARPLGLHTDASEPILLWQYCVSNRHSGREGAGLLQIDGKAEEHAAVYINHHGQRGPLDWLPVFFIDHDDVHGRVVDLRNGQRKIGAREVALDGFVFFGGGLLAFALLQFQAVWKHRNSPAHSCRMRLRDICFEALQVDFFDDCRDIGLFFGEINILDRGFDYGVDLSGKTTLASIRSLLSQEDRKPLGVFVFLNPSIYC